MNSQVNWLSRYVLHRPTFLTNIIPEVYPSLSSGSKAKLQRLEGENEKRRSKERRKSK
jgi:hypothetical protein